MNRKLLALAASAALCSMLNPALAASDCTSNIKPIALKSGLNPVRIGEVKFNILVGRIETGTAHDRDTYSVYIAPDKAGDEWVHVPVTLEEGKEPSLALEDFQSADTTVQKVSFFRSGDSLCVAVASKTGATPPNLYLNATPVKTRIARFNAILDAPWIDPVRVVQSKQKYMDATDFLTKELFKSQ